MNRRVGIVGIGLVTSLGATREETWRRMMAGECGLRDVSVFDSTAYKCRLGGEVDLAPIDAGLTRLERRRWSRSDRMGVAAAAEGLADAGLLESGLDRARIGVFFGAGTADMLRTEDYFRTCMEEGAGHARPSDVWSHFLSTPVDVVAARFGLEGARSCVVAACSSSTIAIGQGADAIRFGRADAVLAGGTDALARLTFSGFNALRLMDGSPCRPFDRSRAGMNIGEGAAVLVLEDLDRARRRGATIYGELAGYAFGCEAFHPTAPEPEGRPVAAVVSAALQDARLDAAAVDHISAHGTATPQNDAAEMRGFRRVFGERAAAIPVTAIKSMIGHCLGAAGGIEAALLALTVHRGWIPPTIHHQEADEACRGDIVANQAREARVRCGVSTSLAFGGNDSAIVITASDDR
jgi:3-oxoacyl-[acyl-carrier-protein] synthase II